jgi:hypothetical protein
MAKKIVSLTIGGKPTDCPALVAIVGGRNAGITNIRAWKALSMSGVVPALPAKTVVCVLKDDKPFRQMTTENLAKGLELVADLERHATESKKLVNALATLQVSFKTVVEQEFIPSDITNQLAGIARPAGKVIAK